MKEKEAGSKAGRVEGLYKEGIVFVAVCSFTVRRIWTLFEQAR